MPPIQIYIPNFNSIALQLQWFLPYATPLLGGWGTFWYGIILGYIESFIWINDHRRTDGAKKIPQNQYTHFTCVNEYKNIRYENVVQASLNHIIILMQHNIFVKILLNNNNTNTYKSHFIESLKYAKKYATNFAYCVSIALTASYLASSKESSSLRLFTSVLFNMVLMKRSRCVLTTSFSWVRRATSAGRSRWRKICVNNVKNGYYCKLKGYAALAFN